MQVMREEGKQSDREQLLLEELINVWISYAGDGIKEERREKLSEVVVSGEEKQIRKIVE